MAYDPICYDLATTFLPKTIREEIRQELAQEIQDNVELFMQYGSYAEAIRQATIQEMR